MSKKIKVITVLGTRPEVIKLAPVIKELKKYKKIISSKVVLTGQHRKMVDQFLDLFNIRPDYDLDIMIKDQTLFDVSSRCIMRLSNVLAQERPDLVLMEGDTTTAFITGLCAFYLKIPVGHVEAGLRTYDKYKPFPEEINRQLISVITDLHFAPTKMAVANLLHEHIDKRRIYLTGNPVIDALYWIAAKKKKISSSLLKKVNFEKKVILVTAHRRESFGAPFKEICKAIRRISDFENVEIIYPVHLNPNVQRPVKKMLSTRKNIHLVAPLDYETFVYLLQRCYLVLSDSGGVQEESPAFGKPILVMREVTERQEGIEAKVARLVGTNSKQIIKATHELLSSKAAYNKMAKSVNPYGDGKAAKKIVKAIVNKYRVKK